VKLHLPLDEEMLFIPAGFERIQKAKDKVALVPARGSRWACDNKQVYVSERAARAVARKRTERAGNKIVAYCCPFYHGWHIGGNNRID